MRLGGSCRGTSSILRHGRQRLYALCSDSEYTFMHTEQRAGEDSEDSGDGTFKA